MLNKNKKHTKKEIWLMIYHTILVIVGSVLLGFGTAIFLTENFIVAGGLSGIAFIVQFFLGEDASMVIDIIVWGATAVLWFVSLIFLGKKFAMQTLLASIVFPLSLTLFYRIPFFQEVAFKVAHQTLGEMGALTPGVDPNTAITTTGDLMLCSIFGGLINGAGVSLTFLGKGSTGGVDVIAFLLNKYTGVKVSNASLTIDLTIITCGIFALDFPNMIDNCLVGIIAATMMMIMVEIIYTRRENAFILDIVSEKWQEIQNHIINELDRGASLIDIEGGFTNEKRKMIRTVLSKNEYVQIKDYLSQIDPNAFCTFTDTNAVFGQGFKENASSTSARIIHKIKSKKNKSKEDKK